jgi:alpha-L-fucosidase
MPSGKIQPEFVSRLREMGQWLNRYGESIYGTRGGPIAPHPWGATTQKGDKVYVHVLECQDATLLLPRFPHAVKSAYFLKDGSKAEYAENDYGLLLRIPAGARDAYDTIVVLELAGQ